MNILFVASECIPFAKTGGLADVVGALPKQLAALGHQVAVVMPNYSSCQTAIHALHLPNDRLDVDLTLTLADRTVRAGVIESRLPDSPVRVFLIDIPFFFLRPELYGENGRDYSDNAARFILLNKALFAAAKAVDFKPDVIHAHDWQTALAPVFLKLAHGEDPFFADCASVLTIHNIAFQGTFWHYDWPMLGLAWEHFNLNELEMNQRICLLKGGIVFCDAMNTVSPTYARDLLSVEGGMGMEAVLRAHQLKLKGILNGVDTKLWSPETDGFVPKNYSAKTLMAGKAASKKALQKAFKLEPNPKVPVFGHVGRLTDQKGFDLMAGCLDELMMHEAQLVVLGTGWPNYEAMLQQMHDRYPKQVGIFIGHNEGLAHLVEAGADFFIMPSRYEPCGLNQLYAMAYGTVPIVRRVGGLADSVVDTIAETLKNGTATGILFNDIDKHALMWALDKALDLYDDRPQMRKVQRNGMQMNFSWEKAAGEYLNLYAFAAAQRRAGVGA
ncbi:MAG: glycogen synthase GlgA [Planctomycetota bacterium]